MEYNNRISQNIFNEFQEYQSYYEANVLPLGEDNKNRVELQ